MPSERPIEGPEDYHNGEHNKPDSDHEPNAGAKPPTSEQRPPAAPNPTALKKADVGKSDASTEVGKENLANKPEAETGRRPSEWFMIFLTFLIALATIVNIWVFYKESEDAGTQTMKLANKAAEIVGTMNTALSNNQEAIRKAFEANRLSLESSQQQSKVALDASIKIARTDQKAWVGVKTARVNFDNDGPEVEFVFTNGGKTPAIDLHFVFLAYFGPLGTNPPFNEAENDAKGRIVIVPNVDTAAKARPSVIPKADIDGIKAGIISFFAYGTVWYKDIFEGRRKTTFCGIYNPIIKQFDACVEHNTAE